MYVAIVWTEDGVRAFGPFDKAQADAFAAQSHEGRIKVVSLESKTEADEFVAMINQIPVAASTP